MTRGIVLCQSKNFQEVTDHETHCSHFRSLSRSCRRRRSWPFVLHQREGHCQPPVGYFGIARPHMRTWHSRVPSADRPLSSAIYQRIKTFRKVKSHEACCSDLRSLARHWRRRRCRHLLQRRSRDLQPSVGHLRAARPHLWTWHSRLPPAHGSIGFRLQIYASRQSVSY